MPNRSRLLASLRSRPAGNRRSFLSSADPVLNLFEETPVGSADSSPVDSFARPVDMAWRDWAIFLLHSAAEVEHALMVQYLFAGYSLRPQELHGLPHQTNEWAKSILMIARQEMGHLMTVQNLLRLIGGPLCLERQDFPLRTGLYPFAFKLERFSKNSLAKYLFAEMSAGPIQEALLPAVERLEIEVRAKTAVDHDEGGGSFINHVGTLYSTLADIFSSRLTAAEFRLDRGPWQTSGWPGTVPNPGSGSKVFLLPVSDRETAIVAIGQIAEQGEASSSQDSHFRQLLKIYRMCPDDTETLTYPVADNPTAFADETGSSLITNSQSALWARLFSLRYRILLSTLQHGASIPATLLHNGIPVANLLRVWVFEEMRAHIPGSLGNLAQARMISMPVGDAATPVCGPVFDLPYTWAFPDLGPDRWRLHRDLVTATGELITALRPLVEDTSDLDAIEERDAIRLTLITELGESEL